jgi:tRNA A37 N6-isopentenylltransferase MiaA
MISREQGETQVVEMLRAQFDYMEGKLSLIEAVEAMKASGSECSHRQLTTMLRSTPRFNVFEFKAPRSEDEV